MSDRMSVVLAVDAQDGRDFLRRNPEVDCAITHLSELRGLSLGSVLQTAAFAEAVSGDTRMQELWTAAHARVTPRYATGGVVRGGDNDTVPVNVSGCYNALGRSSGAAYDIFKPFPVDNTKPVFVPVDPAWSDAQALRARILVLENERDTADATIGSLHREVEELKAELGRANHAVRQGVTALDRIATERDEARGRADQRALDLAAVGELLNTANRERDVFERQAGEREAEIVRLAERQQQVRRDEERASDRAAREIEKNTQARKYIESVEALTEEQGRQLDAVTRQRDGLLRDIKPLRRELAEARRGLANLEKDARSPWTLSDMQALRRPGIEVTYHVNTDAADAWKYASLAWRRARARAKAHDPMKRAHDTIHRAIADLRNLGVYDTPNTKETPVTDQPDDTSGALLEAVDKVGRDLYKMIGLSPDLWDAHSKDFRKDVATAAAAFTESHTKVQKDTEAISDVFSAFFGGGKMAELKEAAAQDWSREDAARESLKVADWAAPPSTVPTVKDALTKPGESSAERVAIDKAWAEAEHAADLGLYADAATLLTAASQAEAAYQARQKPTITYGIRNAA